MVEWVLILQLYAMGPKAEETVKVIEIKGFSTERDCIRAADAAGEVHMLKDGDLNALAVDCRKEKTVGNHGKVGV